MKVDMSFLADAESGKWSVETFTVQKEDFSQMLSFLKTGRAVPEGTYKRLKRS